MSLSESELDRYDRQMRIHGWGAEGQRKLKASKVVVAGIGGLGCLSSLYLAAAGVGTLILLDKESVSPSDLNRQVLFCQSDLGASKAEIAKSRLENLNPEIKVTAAVKEVVGRNIANVMKGIDLVVDGLDNWRTRFIVNELCVRKGIPFVHGGVSEFCGQVMTVVPQKGPCLRCIFPAEPPEVDVVPILGATPAVIASLQVMEAVKLVTGIGKPLVGRMLFLDGEEMTLETVEIERNPDCPVCSHVGD